MLIAGLQVSMGGDNASTIIILLACAAVVLLQGMAVAEVDAQSLYCCMPLSLLV